MIDDYVYLKQYTADDSIYNDIICYLNENTSIFPELYPIIESIKSIFVESQIKISVYTDYENADDKYILIEVCFEEYPDDMLSKIDSLDNVIYKSIHNITTGFITVVTHLI